MEWAKGVSQKQKQKTISREQGELEALQHVNDPQGESESESYTKTAKGEGK